MALYKSLIVLLVATQCDADMKVPDRVLGVFTFEKCAPAIAASLAVEHFNKLLKKSIIFSYESIPISNLTDSSSEKLKNAVIITDSSSVCKNLSDIVEDIGSYLICQEEPTQSMLKLMEYRPNIILSGRNPSSLVHCLFKLEMLIYRLTELPCSDKNSVSLVFTKGHSYEHVEYELFQNLKNAQIPTVNQLELSNQVNLLLNKDIAMLNVPIVNAFVNENDANNLLCHLFHKNYTENQTLIFVGLPRNQQQLRWVSTQNEVNESYNESLTSYDKREVQEPFNCTRKKLRIAAQKHLLLEYFAPGWAAVDNQSVDISQVKIALMDGIRKANAFLQLEEAPLTYDSVWGILKAINRAWKKDREITEESMGRAMLKTFNGISGEKISFVKYRNGSGGYIRNTVDAIISIYRFENDTYVPIGRHFNANSSFLWFDNIFPVGRPSLEWICPTEIRIGMYAILLMICVSLLSLLLLFVVVLHCMKRK